MSAGSGPSGAGTLEAAWCTPARCDTDLCEPCVGDCGYKVGVTVVAGVNGRKICKATIRVYGPGGEVIGGDGESSDEPWIYPGLEHEWAHGPVTFAVPEGSDGEYCDDHTKDGLTVEGAGPTVDGPDEEVTIEVAWIPNQP